MNRNSIVINLYGGPGCGKSTVAAGLFYKFKCHGVYDCELVTEVAKDVIWDGSQHHLANQPFIFGQQYFRIWRLNGKVDIIITDSPILLSINYDVTKTIEFADLVYTKYKEFNNLNFYLIRQEYEQPFCTNGRVNDWVSSLNKDKEIIETIDKYKIPFTHVKGSSEEKTEFIYKNILEQLPYIL